MSLLAIKDLSVQIGQAEILHGINLSVQAGEIVAITGESGSGKSMTALATMGLLPRGAQTQGTVMLDGIDILTTPEPALCQMRGNSMGMVFQEPMTALNPVQTIGAQVAETLLVHRNMPRREAHRQAAEVLQRVGLTVPPDRYPHELSGGQRQRVVIAMAIALRPKLLIADEPTTALDVTTQARILALLRELVSAFDMGLLIITHDLAVVADIADRIVVMQKGRVVEAAPTQTLLAEMRHPYTKSLFAASTHQVDLPDRAPAAPLLRVANVDRDYPMPREKLLGPRPRFRALHDISFEVEHGERVGLVGESGCGKSTLTRAILGLEDVQGGQIMLDGQPVFTGRHPNLTVRRKMQVVFQDPYSSFNPRHRVDRLITEPFHLLERPPTGPARDAAITKALADVGLSPSDGRKYIHEFSGGQRQRIAIARALIVEPELIIFDEAVSALDVSVRAQVLDLIADLCRKRPLGYLFISHDLSVVRTVTDRVLVMQAGRIVEQGPTEDVFNNPQHPYTKSLIAAAPQLPDITHAPETV
ncbi:ABC transporter ATP-binding protein [Yoonia sediminilitoris]|uniref:Peptide/nickel transport system ATP-binding protein n=1 Tax=Yoonia sediminilitoris TaxID=1286148 RepID=A0A2T6KLE6_9RHOB|nr:dipeptide ABC transporter ATP-binding protein [Yoonia sediminilitoris]PUB17026.1 peptide/nickel transport system ATP-binding protein [Yoonia sediminilitoris]RCW97321.1 peptide/nickel transport system ATP-binding protein [Yoonia sediminilitoris]